MNVNILSIVMIGAAFGAGFYYSAKKENQQNAEKLDLIRTNLLNYLDLNFAKDFSGIDEIIEIVDVITENNESE